MNLTLAAFFLTLFATFLWTTTGLKNTVLCRFMIILFVFANLGLFIQLFQEEAKDREAYIQARVDYMERIQALYKKKLEIYESDLKNFAQSHLDAEVSYADVIKENNVYLGEIFKIVKIGNEHNFFYRIPLVYNIGYMHDIDYKTVGYIDIRHIGVEDHKDQFKVFRFNFMNVAKGSDIKNFREEAKALPQDTLDMKTVDIVRVLRSKFEVEPRENYLAYEKSEDRVGWYVEAIEDHKVAYFMVTPHFVYRLK